MDDLMTSLTSSQVWRYALLLVIVWLIVMWLLYRARKIEEKYRNPGGADEAGTKKQDDKDGQGG